MKKLFSLLLLMTCSKLQIQSQDIQDSFAEKIYLHPSQIHLFSEGIFFINEYGVTERACGVFQDDNGIYVITAYYQCPSCGRWNSDGVCQNKKCSLYEK